MTTEEKMQAQSDIKSQDAAFSFKTSQRYFADKKGSSCPKPKQTKSKRAGLVFPVMRVSKLLRKGRYGEKIGATAAVYLTAVMEYLTFEMLDMFSECTKANKCKRITPRYMQVAMKSDQEFATLFQSVDIAQGGVIPFIPAELLKKKKISQ